MNTIWDIVYMRRPVLNYVSPPICEVIFSGSSHPVIILSEPVLNQVTGLVLSGEGAFRLSWNAYIGAICYNIYFIGGDNLAVIQAQCVTDPFWDVPPGLGPGELVVTAITPDGESPPSDPIDLPGGGGQAYTVNVTAPCDQTSRIDFPGVFRISRGGVTSGNLTVYYTMIGDAVNGTDYNLLPLSVVIPNGSTYVDIDIIPVEANCAGQTATLVLSESSSYFIGEDSSAVVLLKKALYRVQGYGTTEPLFSPPSDAGDSAACEWDGTFNSFQDGIPNDTWWFSDTLGTIIYPDTAVQGKDVFFLYVSGPYGGNQWQVAVYCTVEGVSINQVWEGLMVSPAGPEGLYTFSGNPVCSDQRASIIIEIAP